MADAAALAALVFYPLPPTFLFLGSCSPFYFVLRKKKEKRKKKNGGQKDVALSFFAFLFHPFLGSLNYERSA